MYVTPIVLTTGIGVNYLTILLVSRMDIRKTSTNVFMFLTAICNICAILSGVFGIYLNMVWNIQYGQETCKCLTLLRDVTMQTSVAYCVGFTVYRYLVVSRPMRRIDWSGPRRATLFCSTTLLFVVSKNLYLLWTVGTHNGRCGVQPTYKAYYRNVRVWINGVVDVIVPILVVSVCNVLTIRSLATQRISCQQMRMSKATPTRTAIVYLVVALVFYLCLMPVILLLLLASKWAAPGHVKPLLSVKNNIIYVHHSAYFFLYCITGSAVRRELRRLYRDTRQRLFDLCRWFWPEAGRTKRSAVDGLHRPRDDQEAIL